MSTSTPTDGSNDFAHDLAQFSAATTCQSLNPRVIQAVKTNLFDTLACAVAGSSAQGIGELRGLVTRWGGTAQAQSIVFGDRLPAHHVAWLNGAMAHARDYDDTHDGAVLHAGVSVVPAALAAAQAMQGQASGDDFVSGVAVGLETICRLGVATTVGIIESGFMYTPLFGHFAATLAAARVMRLDQATTVNALGISYSQVAGNHQVTRDGALTKRMQPGFAAMSALIAVQLAQTGVRAVQNVFEGEDGFLRVYLHNRCDSQRLRQDLGAEFELEQLSYKPYPCCRFNHSPIAAALALRQAHAFSVADIRRLRVGLNHQAYQAVCTPPAVRKQPQTVVQAQFSVPYTVACALVDGAVGLGHFAPESLGRADLLALAARIEPYVHEDIEREYGRSISPALLKLELHDGRVLTQRMDVPLGHPDNPMLSKHFQDKARDCFAASALAMPDKAVQALEQAVQTIEQQPHVDALMAAACA